MHIPWMVENEAFQKGIVQRFPFVNHERLVCVTFESLLTIGELYLQTACIQTILVPRAAILLVSVTFWERSADQKDRSSRNENVTGNVTSYKYRCMVPVILCSPLRLVGQEPHRRIQKPACLLYFPLSVNSKCKNVRGSVLKADVRSAATIYFKTCIKCNHGSWNVELGVALGSLTVHVL